MLHFDGARTRARGIREGTPRPPCARRPRGNASAAVVNPAVVERGANAVPTAPGASTRIEADVAAVVSETACVEYAVDLGV